MDGKINLELSRPLCLGCAPPSLHRDSFCVQQPPLLAQISLKLAGLMNYSPGIKGGCDVISSLGIFSNELMDSHSSTPQEQIWQLSRACSSCHFRKILISGLLHKNRSRTFCLPWQPYGTEVCQGIVHQPKLFHPD